MKKLIMLISACMVFIMPHPADVSGGQYIKIEKIDTDSAFPRVQIVITASADSSTEAIDGKNLSIHEDGNRIDDAVKITHRASVEEAVHIVISIDSSRSIRKKFLERIKTFAGEIAKHTGPRDKIAVNTFNDSVVLVSDFSPGADLINENIRGIELRGKRTLLHNAIYDSINLCDKIKQTNKKIIVFTDGKDEGSCVSDEELVSLARNAGVPIYFICDKSTAGTKLLARISELTYGKLAYISDSAGIAGILKEVLSSRKNSYTIDYLSRLEPDDKDHKIEVLLSHGAVRDRDGISVSLKKKRVNKGISIPDNAVLTGLIFLFCIMLFVIIILFLIREKKILKDKFAIEKKLLAEKSRQGAYADLLETGPSQMIGPPEPDNPELAYARAWLFQKDGAGAGKKYPIHLPEATIGQDKNSTVIIHDDMVSPLHAKIKHINGAYLLFDLISEQGILLNGKKLLRPKQLCDWDEIRLGKTILIFRGLHKAR